MTKLAAPCYIAWNGNSSALTASLASVATFGSSTIRTMMQIKSGTPKLRIIEWGYSFDTVPTAMVKVELVETGTVGATSVTDLTVAKYNDATGPASGVVIGTNTSGFTAAAASEGTVTATRLFAYQEELGTQFKQQFPLGREPEVNGGSFIRIRATTATAVNMTCYIIWEE